MAKKGNFQRETASLLIAAHTNAIRTNKIEIRGQAESTQITELRSARIPRSVLETCGDLLSLKLQVKTIS